MSERRLCGLHAAAEAPFEPDRVEVDLGRELVVAGRVPDRLPDQGPCRRTVSSVSGEGGELPERLGSLAIAGGIGERLLEQRSLAIGVPDGAASPRSLQPPPVERGSIFGGRERKRLLGEFGRCAGRAARERRRGRGVQRRCDLLVGALGRKCEVARTLLGVVGELGEAPVGSPELAGRGGVVRGRGQQRMREADARALDRDHALAFGRLEAGLAIERTEECESGLCRRGEHDQKLARRRRQPLDPVGDHVSEAFG